MLKFLSPCRSFGRKEKSAMADANDDWKGKREDGKLKISTFHSEGGGRRKGREGWSWARSIPAPGKFLGSEKRLRFLD